MDKTKIIIAVTLMVIALSSVATLFLASKLTTQLATFENLQAQINSVAAGSYNDARQNAQNIQAIVDYINRGIQAQQVKK